MSFSLADFKQETLSSGLTLVESDRSVVTWRDGVVGDVVMVKFERAAGIDRIKRSCGPTLVTLAGAMLRRLFPKKFAPVTKSEHIVRFGTPEQEPIGISNHQINVVTKHREGSYIGSSRFNLSIHSILSGASSVEPIIDTGKIEQWSYTENQIVVDELNLLADVIGRRVAELQNLGALVTTH